MGEEARVNLLSGDDCAEGCPDSYLALDFDPAAVTLDDAFADREPQPCATHLGLHALDPIEFLEKIWQRFCRNAVTTICYANLPGLGIAGSRNHHFPIRAIIFDGIADQVKNDLF